MKLLLDTNFIMDCFRFKIDLAELFDFFPGARLATIPQVVQELKRLAVKKSTHGRYAKIAMNLIDGIEILESPQGNTDETLANMAGKDTIVATNDETLRRKLSAKNLKTIYLRGRKHLAVS